MANLNMNTCTLAGRLTSKPELKTTTNGKSVTTVSLAVNRKTKEKTTDFFNLVAFGTTAENLCKFFDKGSSIAIMGEINNRNWEDKSGNKRISTDIIVHEFFFVDTKTLDQAPNVPTTELAEGEDLPF